MHKDFKSPTLVNASNVCINRPTGKKKAVVFDCGNPWQFLTFFTILNILKAFFRKY